MKKSLSIKILLLIALLTLVSCKKAYTTPPKSNTGRKLQVELRMPEAWQRIVIGPKTAKEYPTVPRNFSMFMTGESTGALKPYMLIEDSTGKEFSVLLITVTHANKSQTENGPLVLLEKRNNATPFLKFSSRIGTETLYALL